MMWPYSWAGWIWMLPVMVLFWGMIVSVAVLLVRAVALPRREGDEAVQTLRKRLASGEISPDEYERSRKLLEP